MIILPSLKCLISNVALTFGLAWILFVAVNCLFKLSLACETSNAWCWIVAFTGPHLTTSPTGCAAARKATPEPPIAIQQVKIVIFTTYFIGLTKNINFCLLDSMHKTYFIIYISVYRQHKLVCYNLLTLRHFQDRSNLHLKVQGCYRTQYGFEYHLHMICCMW